MTIIVPERRRGLFDRDDRFVVPRRPVFPMRPRRSWTPRSRLDLMMAGGIQVGSSGINVNASGIVVAADTDPCCCIVMCNDCASPGNITFTYSSVTLNTGCYGGTSGDGRAKFNRVATTFSGTFIVPYLGTSTVAGVTACTWRKIFVDTTPFGHQLNQLCASPATASIAIDFSRSLQAGHYHIDTKTYFFDAVTGSVADIFFYSGIDDTPCPGLTATYSNQLITPVTTNEAVIGTGGTLGVTFP